MALPVFDKGFTQEEINFGFEKFVEGVKAKVANHYAVDFPTLTPTEIEVQPGRVYWKIVRVDGHNGGYSVYGFVRKVDGAILKAATWKAPALNHARGFVVDSDHGLHCTGPYGIAYMGCRPAGV